MKENNIIQDKSYAFALKIVKTYQELIRIKAPYALSDQILRSGTSIGANVEEAIGGQTKKDFASKISIAYKESRETYFWLRLLSDSKILNLKDSEQLKSDCLELRKILAAIVKTSYKTL